MTSRDLAEMLQLLVLRGAYRQLVLATERDLDGFEPKRDDCQLHCLESIYPRIWDSA